MILQILFIIQFHTVVSFIIWVLHCDIVWYCDITLCYTDIVYYPVSQYDLGYIAFNQTLSQKRYIQAFYICKK